jgi:hypothetical protein
LKDKGLRRRLGAEAAQLAARYDWSIVARQFEEILAMLVDSPKADLMPAQNLTPINA